MGLESASFIDDLVVANPVSGDGVSQGDDHIRLVKTVLKATFPSLDRAIYLEKARADIASAGSVAIGAATTNYLNITGTTTITAFDNVAAGIWRFVRFDGILTLTHNATTLILPSGANITTAVDDHAIFISEGSGNWRCVNYQRKTGKALIDNIPSQTGNSNKYLTTDGSTLSWANAVPAGMITAWPTATAPTGYLECDGSAVSRTTYSALFAVIAETYGNGDGSTTFNLPDLRGEFIRGFDNGAGNDPDAASRTDRGDATTGDNVGTKQLDEYESHTHDYVGNTGTINIDASGSGNLAQVNEPSTATSSSGGNETRPRNVAMMWVIKT